MGFRRRRVFMYVEGEIEMLEKAVEREPVKEQHKFQLYTLFHIGNYSKFIIRRLPVHLSISIGYVMH
jgi:hypothetical protein